MVTLTVAPTRAGGVGSAWEQDGTESPSEWTGKGPAEGARAWVDAQSSGDVYLKKAQALAVYSGQTWKGGGGARTCA